AGEETPDRVAAAERRVEIRARHRARAGAAVAAGGGIVRAAVGGRHVDPVHVDRAPEIAVRRRLLQRVDERLRIGVILRHLGGAVAVAENDDVVARGVGAVIDDLLPGGDCTVMRAHWIALRATAFRGNSRSGRPFALMAASSGAAGRRRRARALAKARPGAPGRPGRT